MERLVTSAAAAGRRTPRAEPGWLVELLRRELAPFPGRGSLVARMVIASTLTMVVIDTFHLPAGALGGFFALIFARQDLRATVMNGLATALFFLLGTVVVIVSLAMLLDSPVTHFVWVAATFFLVFFVMGVAQNYGYASGFAFTLATAIPLWDRPGDVNLKVAGTLYTLLSVAIGAGMTIAVEAVYRIFRPINPIALGVAHRLRIVAEVLEAAGENQLPSPQARSMVLQYADVGVGTLRQQAVRSGELPQTRARVTAAISMSDRVVQLCAIVLKSPSPTDRLLPGEETRLRALSRLLRQQAATLEPVTELSQIGRLRLPGAELIVGSGDKVRPIAEMERTAHLLSGLFQVLGADLAPPKGGAQSAAVKHKQPPPFAGFFKSDAFQNRGYQLFALRGCIATMLCYVIYNAVDWPGISTALATCIITALGTIGASRQKQLLRILGAAIGGFLIALPAQVYLLPRIESITAFTAFFAVVMGLAAWISTASPRLSYMGLQIALAFDLVNLQEPYEQISLSIARDRVVGVLLGLVAMWLVFDQIGGRRAGDSMVELVQANVRALGELAGTLGRLRSTHAAEDVAQARNLQARINETFTAASGQADGVAFEFDRRRARHLRERERMLVMQPPMRSMFTLLIAIFEASLPGSEVRQTEAGSAALAHYLACQQKAMAAIAASYAAQPASAATERVRGTIGAAGEALQRGEMALRGEHRLLFGLCVSLFSALRGIAEAMETHPDAAAVHDAPAP